MKMRKTLLLALLILSALIVLSACQSMVESISVKDFPKSTYKVGESMDLEGGTIEVQYENGKSKTVSMTNKLVEVTGFNSMKVGEISLTVTYRKQICSFKVTIVGDLEEPEVESIAVKNFPKITYKVGESIDLAGGTIEVKYTNGNTQTVNMTDSLVVVTGFDSSAIGEISLTVTYGEQSCSFKVNITDGTVEPELTSIAVETYPAKTVYYIGESLDLIGGSIRLYYSDSSSRVIPMTAAGVTIESVKLNEAGTVSVKVFYEDFDASFEIMVLKAVNPDSDVKSISILREPTKLEYFVGDDVNPAGGIVRVTFNDDTFTNFSMDSAEIKVVYSLSIAGYSIVTVIYENYTASFEVTVLESAFVPDWEYVAYMVDMSFHFFNIYIDTPFIYTVFELNEYRSKVHATGNSEYISYFSSQFDYSLNLLTAFFTGLTFKEGMYGEDCYAFLYKFTRMAFLWETDDDYTYTSDAYAADAYEIIYLYSNLSYYEKYIATSMVSAPGHNGMYNGVYYFSNLTVWYFMGFLAEPEYLAYFNMIRADIFLAEYYYNNSPVGLIDYIESIEYALGYYAEIENKAWFDYTYGSMYTSLVDYYNSIPRLPSQILAIIKHMTVPLMDGLVTALVYGEYSVYMAHLLNLFEMVDEAKFDPELYKIIMETEVIYVNDVLSTIQQACDHYMNDFNYLMAEMGIYADFYSANILPVIQKWVNAGGGVYMESPKIDREVYPEFDDDIEELLVKIYNDMSAYQRAYFMCGPNYHAITGMVLDHFSYLMTHGEYMVYEDLYYAGYLYHMFFIGEGEARDFLFVMERTLDGYTGLSNTIMFDSLHSRFEIEYFIERYEEVTNTSDLLTQIINLMVNQIVEGKNIAVQYGEYSYYLAYLAEFFRMVEEAKQDPDMYEIIMNEKMMRYNGDLYTIDEMRIIFTVDYNEMLSSFVGFADFYLEHLLPIIIQWLYAGGGIYDTSTMLNREYYPNFDADIEALHAAIYEKLSVQQQSVLFLQGNMYVLSHLFEDHHYYLLSHDETVITDWIYDAKLTYYEYQLGLGSTLEDFQLKMEAVIRAYNNASDKSAFNSLYCKTEYEYLMNIYDELSATDSFAASIPVSLFACILAKSYAIDKRLLKK